MAYGIFAIFIVATAPFAAVLLHGQGLLVWLYLAGILFAVVLPAILGALCSWQERRSLRAYRRRTLLDSAERLGRTER